MQSMASRMASMPDVTNVVFSESVDAAQLNCMSRLGIHRVSVNGQHHGAEHRSQCVLGSHDTLHESNAVKWRNAYL
jgi:hypothetical protein